ncbi:MAG TPA: branched-chain amino acid ABC transporter permease, partial [Ramlibacter sp.]|nr:branched-chain amino acid ABC transporter permease [Ramlibacter sp.]
IVVLMRGGVVAFGQGMVFAVGGYTAALAFNKLGLTDALGLALCGGIAAMVVAAPFAPLLSRYRGIFFAMLTLALSMVMYGLLMKLDVLGGSDGFNIGRPTLLGRALPDARVGYIIYLVTVVVAIAMAALARIYFDSTRGLITLAVRENELRVEYLGGSVRQAMAINFILAAFTGGLGGALAVLALGHIDPNFSYWTTSGEFVFVAILAGWQSIAAVFVASTVLEVVRSFSSSYFPNTWQLALGLFLLFVIRFLPRGIGSLWVRGPTK